MSDLLRVYYDPAEIGLDGYPYAWHKGDFLPNDKGTIGHLAIKDLIRKRDGHRCLRCHHPYRKGEHGSGEWSPCDNQCSHGGPIRRESFESGFGPAEAQWRILTVHHLSGQKEDCRWHNLVSLCQRCLAISLFRRRCVWSKSGHGSTLSGSNLSQLRTTPGSISEKS